MQTSRALSIQFRFEISEISRAQWNGTFRLHRPDPSHRAFCEHSTVEKGRWKIKLKAKESYFVEKAYECVTIGFLPFQQQIGESSVKRTRETSA